MALTEDPNSNPTPPPSSGEYAQQDQSLATTHNSGTGEVTAEGYSSRFPLMLVTARKKVVRLFSNRLRKGTQGNGTEATGNLAKERRKADGSFGLGPRRWFKASSSTRGVDRVH
jgi:hypothetical protein